jgi:nicotinamide mononucleotide transporter
MLAVVAFSLARVYRAGLVMDADPNAGWLDSWILATLTAITAVVAGILLWLGHTTWLEAISFVTGALCVWLTVKESVWNFPVSMANVAAFLFVFVRARLYADAGLQVAYFILSAIGWYLWLYGGQGRRELHLSQITRGEATRVASVGIMIAIVLTLYLSRVGGAAPFWDALTTTISLCAQWLLNRKYLENWYCWIAADVIYIPLYLSKSLYLTSLLYAVFLCMAIMGLFAWRATWRRMVEEPPPPARGFEVIVS